MPPLQSRMTKNMARPKRYRPGKDQGPSESSSSESSEGEEVQPQRPKPAPPKATSFPAHKMAQTLQNVDLSERRQKEQEEARRKAKEEHAWREKLERDAGFVTESESESESENETRDEAQKPAPAPMPVRQIQKLAPRETPKPTASSDEEASDSDSGSGSGSDSDSDSDSGSSSSSSAAPKLMRPIYIPKEKRDALATTATASTGPPISTSAAPTDPGSRKSRLDAQLQQRLEQRLADRAAHNRAWDDDEANLADEDQVDDRDGLDPALEHAQWTARALARLKRSRAALEQREAELQAIADEKARREGMTEAEREAEDKKREREILAERRAKKEAKDDGGGGMQKYHHKGAFLRDEADGTGLLERDLMNARYVDRDGMVEARPKYLQVRDSTMIGRKGRQRHRDLKSEDTGRWGDYGRRRGGAPGGYEDVQDERFRADGGRDRGAGSGATGATGATGANAGALGERKRAGSRERGRDSEAKKARV